MCVYLIWQLIMGVVKELQSKRGKSDNFFPYMESRLKIKKSKKVDRGGGRMRRMGRQYAYWGDAGMWGVQNRLDKMGCSK